MGHQLIPEIFQVVRLFNGETKFLYKRLQVFLGGLLAVEAALIVQGLARPRDEFRGSIIALGLFDPFLRCSFHRESCP